MTVCVSFWIYLDSCSSCCYQDFLPTSAFWFLALNSARTAQVFQCVLKLNRQNNVYGLSLVGLNLPRCNKISNKITTNLCISKIKVFISSYKNANNKFRFAIKKYR